MRFLDLNETPRIALSSRRFACLLAAVALACCLGLSGCGNASDTGQQSNGSQATIATASGDASITVADIPEYSGTLTFEVNGSVPGFTSDELQQSAYLSFSDLDFEGRCGAAMGMLGTETVTDAERGDISKIHPSGWEQARYSFIDGETLWTRSHLIAHQLSGENANERNLITGTRTFNAQGMLYYEEVVGDYIRDTGNHVLYRVTPIFAANDLVARGVQMEAMSVEDGGQDVCFNVFVYNVEPGVGIDYATGESWEDSSVPEASVIGANTATSANEPSALEQYSTGNDDEVQTYVLNTGGLKFHRPDCQAVDTMSQRNKKEFTGTRAELIAQGYAPCGSCNP